MHYYHLKNLVLDNQDFNDGFHQNIPEKKHKKPQLLTLLSTIKDFCQIIFIFTTIKAIENIIKAHIL